jgi:putative ABC transport system substrate-binding protein
MWRRSAGILLTLVLLVTPLAGDGHAGEKVWRIGWLRGFGPPRPLLRDAFRQGLHDLGYGEGQHYVIEYRYGEGDDLEPVPRLATELSRLPVDVFLTHGSAATLAVHEMHSTIPTVFYSVPDPVERGIVASLARPGGHITGVANASFEFMAWKLLELLKEVAPQATRVAVLENGAWTTAPAHTPEGRLYAASRQAIQAAATALGLQAQHVPVRDPATELAHIFAALTHPPIDAFYVWQEQLLGRHRAQIVEHVNHSRLPAIYGARGFVEAGGLMSYQADEVAMMRRAGVLVGKILQGAKPADLPVEQPLTYHLAINLKTAKALGITIPPSLLVLANEVIQ